jgi:hypothetical protein
MHQLWSLQSAPPLTGVFPDFLGSIRAPREGGDVAKADDPDSASGAVERLNAVCGDGE